MIRPALLLSLALAAPGLSSRVSAASLTESIEAIRSVGPEGKGTAAASAAVRELSMIEVAALPAVLSGMDGANELALNWLRAAVETVAARAASGGQALPLSALDDFVRDRSHHPRARELAYELISGNDPAVADRLVEGMLDDPSTVLRREAVQRLVTEAGTLLEAGKTNAALAQYHAALKPARDVNQIQTISKVLGELGEPVALPDVFGWVMNWHVIGPFDNTGGTGYERVFAPEQRVDLNAEYDGKSGKVRWKEFASTDDYGKVDFNQPLGGLKEATGYAWTEFHSDRARPVELRLACKNGWKIWLNGTLVFGRDEYHRGTEIDHYRLPGELKQGANSILIKLCQNELTHDWAKEWEFQLRLTDAIGTPVASVRP